MPRVGRPKTDTEPVTLRLPRQMIETLDDLRRQEKDIPSRPEMIRRILVSHLKIDDEG
ncbi:ribbon-helix-helix protein, CopG family [Tabrizicola sp. DMG-N-6]|uniref:Ribbon-helix-helix protein, CopG family n=2 Tax=Szabonella alba TaxID=2804194 RepID=A0A8K0VEF9_9RHOB|nr:ribbon-helix-helix protein, CopG family [Szabonella alba]